MSGRSPPAYSKDPDDPFQSTLPADPNLSYTTPPDPANMTLPDNASEVVQWHVLGRARAAGITSNWLLANSLLHGVPGQTHVSYSTWEAALAGYTTAYDAGAIEIYAPGSARTRRSNTPATPGARRRNAHYVASNAPTPQRPILVQSSPASPSRSEARLRTIQQAISELDAPATQAQTGNSRHPQA